MGRGTGLSSFIVSTSFERLIEGCPFGRENMSMVKNGRALLLVAALVAMGCGDDGGPVDGVDGGPGVDAMTGDGDGGPGACVADMANAASTVGCNGGFSSEPAMNAPGGRCTPGSDAMPAGTCTTEGAICMGDLTGSGQGWCVISCAPAETYVDAQTCPSGFRCFRFPVADTEDFYGLCFRDCDPANPCHEGWECNTEGRCIEQGST